MARLPMKIRMDLREHWEKPDCPAMKSIVALKDLLGLPVTIALEPVILWAELEKYYPDQAVFVPSITGAVKAWCDCLATRLQDDANAEWADQLLEIINGSRKGMKARLEAKPGTKSSTSLSKPNSTFIISIPQSAPPLRNASAYFETDFSKLFSKPSGPIPSHEDDDWASVALPSHSQPQPHQPSSSSSAAQTTTELPTLDSLPRPETLFQTTAPYHLLLRIIHNGIQIHSSHQPTLELLAAYLQKYVRSLENSTLKVPIIQAELKPSHLGYGALFDTLNISPGDPRGTWSNINPVFLLSFVEGVLGYRPVGDESGNGGSVWYFKRDVAFKE